MIQIPMNNLQEDVEEIIWNRIYIKKTYTETATELGSEGCVLWIDEATFTRSGIVCTTYMNGQW
jgi:hypothetical protein